MKAAPGLLAVLMDAMAVDLGGRRRIRVCRDGSAIQTANERRRRKRADRVMIDRVIAANREANKSRRRHEKLPTSPGAVRLELFGPAAWLRNQGGR